MARAGEVPAAVFFDMDDTVFDHALTCRDALGRLAQEHPLFRQRRRAELVREYSRLLEAVHPDVLAGHRDANEARRDRFVELARFCGRDISQEEAARLSTRYRELYQSLRRAVPGAREMLRRLHGRTVVGIVTNNEVREQREKLAYLGAERWVDLLVVSEEVGASKPDPQIFATALARAGASAEETVMIGDSWQNDVLGARNVGIGAVWFNRFGAEPPSAIEVPEVRSFRAPRQTEEVLFQEARRPRPPPR